jgi:hypothetical protein
VCHWFSWALRLDVFSNQHGHCHLNCPRQVA